MTNFYCVYYWLPVTINAAEVNLVLELLLTKTEERHISYSESRLNMFSTKAESF